MTTDYQPGAHPASIAPGRQLMVAASHHELLRRLHGTAWSIAEVIEALAAEGLAAVPDFACVLSEADEAHVLVRGGFTVHVERDHATDEVRIDGTGVATWVESRLSKVDGVRITAAGAPEEGTVWPVESGVVLASMVRSGTAARALPVLTDAEAAVEASPVVEPLPAVEPEPVVEPEALVEAPPVVEPESVPEPEPDVPDQVEESAPSADPNETIIEPADGRFEAMFGVTVPGRRVEDAAVRAPEPGVAPVPSPPRSSPPAAVAGDHDGRTMTPAQFAALRAGRGDGDVTQGPALGATLTFSSGQVVAIDRTVVVGRRPQARQVSSLDLPLLVVLDNPYVSGTHLEFHLEADTVLVTDVSSNGTLLTRSGGRPERLRSGQPTPLSDGAVLQLTEGLTATVSIGRGTES